MSETRTIRAGDKGSVNGKYCKVLEVNGEDVSSRTLHIQYRDYSEEVVPASELWEFRRATDHLPDER